MQGDCQHTCKPAIKRVRSGLSILCGLGPHTLQALPLERMPNILDINNASEFRGLRDEARVGETVG